MWYSRLRVMEKKIETTRKELAKIEEGLEKFEILPRSVASATHERSAPDVAASD